MPRIASKQRKPSPRPQPAEPAARPGPWRLVTAAAFFLSIVLVIARATMEETFRPDSLPVPGNLAVPSTPAAATSVWLDLACCLPAILVLARRLLDRDFALKLAWSHLAMFLLGAWTLASIMWSSDKFAAAVSASNWAAALVLLWSTSQLARRWLRLRVLAAVGFGLLLVLLVQGYYYRFVDLPDLQRNWREHRQEMLAQRGTDPTSLKAIQIGKNIASGEVSGFSLSRNTYAALLVLLATLAAAIVMQRIKDGDASGWYLPIVLVIAAALVMLYRYVGSKTAFATPLIGAVLLATVWRARPVLSRYARALYWGGVGLFAVAVAAVVGHGLRHGTLLHVSLTFRWQYWVGASRALVHHLWLGVGWANFGPYYLIYRLPQAAEEPADPHNFLVRAFVELGIVGGVLMLAWMLRMWWELTAGARADERSTQAQPATRYRPAVFLAAIAIASMALNAVVSIDWTQGVDWIFLECFKRALFLVALAAGMALVAVRSWQTQELDDRPAPWLFLGLLVGLGLFLLHNLIDFSIFEPGPMFLFALLAGGALGVRLEEHPRRRRNAAALAVFIMVGIGWIVAAGVWAVPLAEAESLVHEADEQVRTSVEPHAPAGTAPDPAALEHARQDLIKAHRLLPLDAEYLFRAEQAGLIARSQPLLLRQLLDEAIARDPMSVQYRIARAQLEAAASDPAHAVADFQAAIGLDPNDLTLRLQYADYLRGLGRRSDTAAEYQKVIDLNSRLAPDEIRRLPEARVAELRQIIRSLNR